jgi:hypothetical protein
MSATPAVTFDPDPSRSPHVLVALGSSLVPAGQDLPHRPRPWAQITIFTGGGDGAIPARDAVMMLAPALSVQALRAAAVGEPYAAVWAQACASVEGPPHEDPKNVWAFGSSLWDSATTHPMAFRPGPYGGQPEPRAALYGPSIEDVFTRVRDYARRYGAHPDFRARDLPTITKVNNYISSTYGEPLSATVLEAVRARLAAEA